MTPTPPPGGRRTRAIIAAKNSASTIGATVAALRNLPEVDDVLVVDDGSSDDTAELARAAGAWVLRLPRNRGKGGAVAAGVAAMPETDVYLLADADLGSTASGCAALLEPVLSGEADLAVGVLPPAAGRGGFGLVRDAAATGIRRACGFRATAPISGQRAVRGPVLRSIRPAARFGLEVGMTIDAVRGGARVVEVPVEVDHDHRGRSLGGFVHRAGQGADIVRALWPRLTGPRSRTAIILATAVLVLATLLAAGARWEAPSVAGGPAQRVLIVGWPGLAWEDLGPGVTPELARLISEGALGAMTVRTRSSRPGVTEAYATLGAGSRVRAAAGVASELRDVGGGLTALIDAEMLRNGAGRNTAARTGALGGSVRTAGLATAAVGNADVPAGLVNVRADGELRPARFHPAAAVVADGDGVVERAAVGGDLLLEDASAPFGLRADPDAVVAAAASALADAEVVVVDSGDLTRVAALAEPGGPVTERHSSGPSLGEGLPRYRARALADTDALLGRLVAAVPPGTLVLVASVVPPDRAWRLTPVVAWGSGVTRGELHSPSTRQRGLVTLTDVAPTVLDTLGVEVPAAMVGRPFRYVGGRPDADRLSRLDAADSYRERMYVPVVGGFVIFQLAVYLVVWRIARRRPPDSAPSPSERHTSLVAGLHLMLLGVAAWPLATFLFRAASFATAWGRAGLIVLLAIDLALVAGTRLPGLGRRARRRPLEALGWVFAATVTVVLVDVATGGRLQTASFFGHWPQVGGRFYGMGNAAFAVVGASAMLAAMIHLEHAPRRREALFTAGAFLAVVAAADGAPSVGNDVGGILTLVPVFVLALLAAAGRRLTARLLVLATAAVTVVLGLAVMLDFTRAPAERTHLGRLAERVADEGVGPLISTMARKADVSVAILGESPWTWMAPVVALAMLAALMSRSGAHNLLPPGSPRRIGFAATLGVALLGAAVNDSGAVVTAIVLAYLGVFAATVALEDRFGPRPADFVLLEPASASAPFRQPTGPGTA